MIIDNWLGLASADSPYRLQPGAAVEQVNLQINKSGLLTPRAGMELVFQVATGPVRAIYSYARGYSQSDLLFVTRSVSDSGSGQQYIVSTVEGSPLSETEVFRTSTAIRPSFTQDRHGTVFMFAGLGVRPRIYRPGIDSQFVTLGLAAPTISPTVTPAGDGFFIERIDVLSSGTSYYTPPTITITPAPGDTPARNARARAVVQAGAIVAVDVVDGGSNYSALPSIGVSNEQVGTGFLGRGVLSVSSAVYGFLSSTAPTVTGTYVAGQTHAVGLTGPVEIAYRHTAGAQQSVPAVFDSVSGKYTAVIPLAGGSGSGAFASFQFLPISAAYAVGNTAPALPQGVTADSTFITSTGANQYQFSTKRANWYVTDDYFENTDTPANANKSNNRYNAGNNKDSFWGVMPKPGEYVFTKRQIRRRYITDDDFWGNNQTVQYWARYYFPNYGSVGYRLLTGPESGMSTEANWTVGSSPVQFSGGRAYIDITLAPCKKADGTAYAEASNTAYPVIRVHLSQCPESWTVSNTAPLSSGDAWQRRWQPLCGQDRRQNFNDPATSQTNSTPSGVIAAYSLQDNAITALDEYKRWYASGHAAGYPFARPITDFRTQAAGDTVGIGSGTIEVLNPGAQMENGTKFVLRFEQFNAYDYRNSDVGSYSTTWTTTPDSAPTLAVSDMARKGNFGETYTDFYLSAGALDTVGGDPSGLLPGAVVGDPSVTISGSGWTASGQNVSVTLRQRTTSDPPSYSDSQTFQFATTTLVPAVAGSRIASVTVLSGGQNYFREPTLLFRGGNGYGLRTQATLSNGRIQSVVVLDGGDGFTTDTELYTDVQPAKLLPVLRGTMRGTYRCAYRFADYRQTAVLSTTITLTLGSTTATLGSASGVQVGMQITGSVGAGHLNRIVSINGSQVTLLAPATATGTQSCTVRDMDRPIAYSDFSPIVDVDATANGSERASQMNWTLPSVVAPERADFVEFFRTSADESLVFYRLSIHGTASGGIVTIHGSDTLSDEELFDPDRIGYAALPVVLPNGNLNAYRFGTARTDMAVAVSWQDRLWYGVSTSGESANTVFFSEFDEYESNPAEYELPIQQNLRNTDYLTAIVPFGSALLLMQTSHCYSLSYNSDPLVDAAISLVSHRGVFNHFSWDIHDEYLYAADSRGIYRMSMSGAVVSLSDNIRNYWTDGLLNFTTLPSWHLKIDRKTATLRFFTSLVSDNSPTPSIALCYSLETEAWWVEKWPNSFTAACDFQQATAESLPCYGAMDGNLYRFGGLKDVSFRDIQSVTVTNGGSGYTSPPAVSAPHGYGAIFQPLLQDGVVKEILVVDGGFNYGQLQNDGSFSGTAALVFSGGGGSGAAANATAREPNSGEQDDLPILIRTTVPWRIRTKPMALLTDGNARGAEGQVDRSVTVTYRPTETSATLNLREFYNNSSSPRQNVMARNRGTGFVHRTDGAKTTLDMSADRSPLGKATGLAQARFAGRSLTDLASADQHISIELSRDASVAAATESEPLLYQLQVNGVAGGE